MSRTSCNWWSSSIHMSDSVGSEAGSPSDKTDTRSEMCPFNKELDAPSEVSSLSVGAKVNSGTTSATDESITLPYMPNEVYFEIFKYLREDRKNLYNAIRVSKTWAGFAKSALWRSIHPTVLAMLSASRKEKYRKFVRELQFTTAEVKRNKLISSQAIRATLPFFNAIHLTIVEENPCMATFRRSNHLEDIPIDIGHLTVVGNVADWSVYIAKLRRLTSLKSVVSRKPEPNDYRKMTTKPDDFS
ncbi:hypothetical protein K470DRAFT_263149 [Piedraia hortae CBS 480.64]|uniref:F-box domain-containing protein n=1 Tax=Piedraia hortae CBS 480.64 TaxID=1314780 RepID=A0A6A7C4Y2_9PEZI|nr:hypothetical protein K470DRAFT_263149 [Piedraia hortae CBS 480.64]